nr:PEGA domain-containing protein [Kofleriaceae bacterium]
MRALAIAALLAVTATAHADRVVAIAPLSTLGAEDTSAATKKLATDIEAATAALPGTKVVTTAQVVAAIKKANQPQLKTCEGDAACLAELGKLVGATQVVSGEIGGLGASTVIYLTAADVSTGKELRSATLEVDRPNGAAAAMTQLLDPDRYKGTLKLVIDAAGSKVQVNGDYKALDKSGAVELPVGTHAVRVTNPQYHDFAKFVNIDYGKVTEVKVGMQAYPMVEHDVQGKPTNLDQVIYDRDPPLWRRWYVSGPAIIVLAVGAGILAGVIAHDFPSANQCRTVGGMMCSP